MGDHIVSRHTADGTKVPLRFVIVDWKEATQPGYMFFASRIQLPGCRHRAWFSRLGFWQEDATKGGRSQGVEGT